MSDTILRPGNTGMDKHTHTHSLPPWGLMSDVPTYMIETEKFASHHMSIKRHILEKKCSSED